MSDKDFLGENIRANSDFKKYTNDLLYDNKITWNKTISYFNKENGLDTSSTQEDKIKIFGMPWYLYPELSGTDLTFDHSGFIRGKKEYNGKSFDITGNSLDKTKKLIRKRFLDSTVTIRAVPRDDDPYGNIYRQMCNLLGQVNSLLTFLTTPQWTNREAIHKDIESKQITMYTDLITEETHNNVQYQLSNEVDPNKLKHFGDVFSDMISSSVFGPFYDYGINYGFKGLMGVGKQFFGGVFSFHHWTKMMSRETINLWRAGKVLMNTNFEFNFRASSHQTLREFFLPILFLTQVQQPNSIQIDSGFGGFKIIEQVPPIPVDLIVGNPLNPIIRLGKSIITNLKVEIYDYKYLRDQFSDINRIIENDAYGRISDMDTWELLGQGNIDRVPTQQRVQFDIEPIVPIVQFSEMLSKETDQNTAGQSQLTE